MNGLVTEDSETSGRSRKSGTGGESESTSTRKISVGKMATWNSPERIFSMVRPDLSAWTSTYFWKLRFVPICSSGDTRRRTALVLSVTRYPNSLRWFSAKLDCRSSLAPSKALGGFVVRASRKSQLPDLSVRSPATRSLRHVLPLP